MITKPVKYGTTSFHKNPVFRIFNDYTPIETLSYEDLENNRFLCLTKFNDVFVSNIKHSDSFGYYVDDIKSKTIIPIDNVLELHIIYSPLDSKESL